MSNATALILCAVLVIFFGVPIVASPFVLGGICIAFHLIVHGPD